MKNESLDPPNPQHIKHQDKPRNLHKKSSWQPIAQTETAICDKSLKGAQGVDNRNYSIFKVIPAWLDICKIWCKVNICKLADKGFFRIHFPVAFDHTFWCTS